MVSDRRVDNTHVEQDASSICDALDRFRSAPAHDESQLNAYFEQLKGRVRILLVIGLEGRRPCLYFDLFGIRNQY